MEVVPVQQLVEQHLVERARQPDADQESRRERPETARRPAPFLSRSHTARLPRRERHKLRTQMRLAILRDPERLKGACAMTEARDPTAGLPPDPSGIEEPHDVLAAEEFAMPSPDERSGGRLTELPPDPTGIEEPHDVLAAEEFAMPSPEERASGQSAAGRPSQRGGNPAAIAAAAALLVLLLVVLRRRRS